MAKNNRTKNPVPPRRTDRPTTLGDPLPGMNEEFTVAIENLVPLSSYNHNDQPVWRYIRQAVLRRHRHHPILFCLSAADSQYYVEKWDWDDSKRVLSVTLQNPILRREHT